MSHSSQVSRVPGCCGCVPADRSPASASEIDAGFRLPLWGWFGGAVFWLVVATLLGFLAAIKMHAPGFLADIPWLGYGRVRPAASNVFLFGFACQAAFGLSLWMLARLGRTSLVGAGAVAIAAKFWNIGVLVGVGAILAGGATGFERLEFPGYALGILFASFVVTSVCALLTFQARQVRELYPAQWFLLGSWIWFPWVFSTGWLLLVAWPVRGAVQMAVQSWYSNGLQQLFLWPVGVAALLYFFPVQAGRPLPSRYLAMFAFWTQALFAGWGGLHNGAPLPAWIVALSVVSGVLLLMPAWATLANVFPLVGAAGKQADSHPARPFLRFGLMCFSVSSLLGVLHAIPAVNRTTQFSLFVPGLELLFLSGFFASTAFAAIYHIAPLVAGVDWPCSLHARIHYRLHVAGVILASAALIIGGVIHGNAWNNPNIAPIDVARKILPFMGTATLGSLLLFGGSVCLAVNFSRMVLARCRVCCQPWIQSASAPVHPAGVKA
jgi:cytochrome c oxidase cbb3-type subunit 1